MSERQHRRRRIAVAAQDTRLAAGRIAPVGQRVLPYSGSCHAEVLVICDVPTKKAWDRGLPIEGPSLSLFADVMTSYGFTRDSFAFLAPCPPMPDTIAGSAARESKFIAEYRDEVLEVIAEHKPKLLVYMGGTAGRQVVGKQVAITRARGQMYRYDHIACPVVALLSPGHVLRRPELQDIFRTDSLLLSSMRDGGYTFEAAEAAVDREVNYYWCTDIQHILDADPAAVVVDTEATGLRWYDPSVEILTVQITYKEGESAVIPLHRGFWPELGPRTRRKLIGQIKQLLENPNVTTGGHNLKFDCHMLREKLGIKVAHPDIDTQLLAFAADDNMQEKSLDECVRRWVPEMAGYADEFNATVDKSKMIEVPRDKFLLYAGGDTDATYRLIRRLLPLVQQDEKQWRVYTHVQMPALQAFQNYVEPEGLAVDTLELVRLQEQLDQTAKEMYDELIAMVPAAVKRKHADKGLRFSRTDFVRDILFSREGFNLKPVKFTKSTEKLAPAERMPSTSAKDHLPYFEDEPFVALYMQYTKVEKMRGTYVGLLSDPSKGGDPSGFWKYIVDGKVHPSYMLHRTNTGRTASSDPNGQNFPKRSALAKAYRKIFYAPAGYKLVEADLSQAELRIAAWMAGETNMIRIYQMDGDIHAATAAELVGITYERYVELKDDETPVQQARGWFTGVDNYLHTQPKEIWGDITVKKFLKDKRQQAKAVNFGFLYGMGWRKFMSYAKTDYGVTFTEAEAKDIRRKFFKKYPRLERWHQTMRGFVHEHGYVRALHGALRRLPSIYSNDEGVVAGAERNAVNSPVQRFASDLGLIALARMCRDMPEGLIKPVAFIHDALVCLVREDMAEVLAGNIKWYMETPPLEAWFGLKAPLPIRSDVDIGDNLGDMPERPDIKAIQPEWARPELDLAMAA